MASLSASTAGALRWSAIALIAVAACIPAPPAAPAAPARPALPPCDSTAALPAARGIVAVQTVVHDVPDLEYTSTIGAAHPDLAKSSYELFDSNIGLFRATDESFTDDCKGTPINAEYTGNKLLTMATGKITNKVKKVGKKVIDKGKKLVNKVKGKAGGAPDADQSAPDADQSAPDAGQSAPDAGQSAPDGSEKAPDSDPAAAAGEAAEDDLDLDVKKRAEKLLGPPLKSASRDVLQIIEGTKKRSLFLDDDEMEGCTCNTGAFQIGRGMCKAQVYRLQEDHDVWQLVRSTDGKMPTYPFSKNWNPFAMPLPIPRPPFGYAYFQCRIPHNTMIAVGIAPKVAPGAKPPTLKEALQGPAVTQTGGSGGSGALAPAPYNGPASRPSDGAPASRPSDGSPASRSDGSPSTGTEGEEEEPPGPPQYITQWYIADTAGKGTGSGVKPPMNWGCKPVPLVCNLIGCIFNPETRDMAEGINDIIMGH